MVPRFLVPSVGGQCCGGGHIGQSAHTCPVQNCRAAVLYSWTRPTGFLNNAATSPMLLPAAADLWQLPGDSICVLGRFRLTGLPCSAAGTWRDRPTRGAHGVLVGMRLPVRRRTGRLLRDAARPTPVAQSLPRPPVAASEAETPWPGGLGRRVPSLFRVLGAECRRLGR